MTESKFPQEFKALQKYGSDNFTNKGSVLIKSEVLFFTLTVVD